MTRCDTANKRLWNDVNWSNYNTVWRHDLFQTNEIQKYRHCHAKQNKYCNVKINIYLTDDADDFPDDALLERDFSCTCLISLKTNS